LSSPSWLQKDHRYSVLIVNLLKVTSHYADNMIRYGRGSNSTDRYRPDTTRNRTVTASAGKGRRVVLGAIPNGTRAGKYAPRFRQATGGKRERTRAFGTVQYGIECQAERGSIYASRLPRESSGNHEVHTERGNSKTHKSCKIDIGGYVHRVEGDRRPVNPGT
jgi:hypothetical protein